MLSWDTDKINNFWTSIAFFRILKSLLHMDVVVVTSQDL
jgi:hypothetical protein